MDEDDNRKEQKKINSTSETRRTIKDNKQYTDQPTHIGQSSQNNNDTRKLRKKGKEAKERNERKE